MLVRPEGFEPPTLRCEGVRGRSPASAGPAAKQVDSLAVHPDSGEFAGLVVNLVVTATPVAEFALPTFGQRDPGHRVADIVCTRSGPWTFSIGGSCRILTRVPQSIESTKPADLALGTATSVVPVVWDFREPTQDFEAKRDTRLPTPLAPNGLLLTDEVYIVQATSPVEWRWGEPPVLGAEPGLRRRAGRYRCRLSRTRGGDLPHAAGQRRRAGF